MLTSVKQKSIIREWRTNVKVGCFTCTLLYNIRIRERKKISRYDPLPVTQYNRIQWLSRTVKWDTVTDLYCIMGWFCSTIQSLYPILQFNSITVSDFAVQSSHCIRFYSTIQSLYPILQYKSVILSNFTVQISHCIQFYSTNLKSDTVIELNCKIGYSDWIVLQNRIQWLNWTVKSDTVTEFYLTHIREINPCTLISDLITLNNLRTNSVTVSDFTVQISHFIEFYSTNQSLYPILQYKSVTVSHFTVQISHCIPFYSTNQSLYPIIQYKSVTVSHFTVRLSHCMRLYCVCSELP
jgi:hypothetical protein